MPTPANNTATAVRLGLLGLRIAIGAAVGLKPQAAARVLGVPRSPYLFRLWSARNLALAAGTATASPSARAGWLAVNLTIDLADLAAGIALRRSRTLTIGGPAMAATFAAVAIVREAIACRSKR